MGVASPEVQDSFKVYQEALISFMGQTLPAMVPNPDEMANLGMQPPMQPAPQQLQGMNNV